MTTSSASSVLVYESGRLVPGTRFLERVGAETDDSQGANVNTNVNTNVCACEMKSIGRPPLEILRPPKWVLKWEGHKQTCAAPAQAPADRSTPSSSTSSSSSSSREPATS